MNSIFIIAALLLAVICLYLMVLLLAGRWLAQKADQMPPWLKLAIACFALPALSIPLLRRKLFVLFEKQLTNEKRRLVDKS